jgi:CHASE3 domain sensor protein
MTNMSEAEIDRLTQRLAAAEALLRTTEAH